jgi:hypothetical protein
MPNDQFLKKIQKTMNIAIRQRPAFNDRRVLDHQTIENPSHLPDIGRSKLYATVELVQVLFSILFILKAISHFDHDSIEEVEHAVEVHQKVTFDEIAMRVI